MLILSGSARDGNTARWSRAFRSGSAVGRRSSTSMGWTIGPYGAAASMIDDFARVVSAMLAHRRLRHSRSTGTR